MAKFISSFFFIFAALQQSVVLLAQRPVPIPLRKVVLYKNGMGYFEHQGPVRGAQSVEIVLPSTQLNDVLKSLTVLDLGSGAVTGVTYDSTAPLSRRLAELPIDLSFSRGLLGFLNQIRGASIEIRAPGSPVTGKLMGAELRTKSIGANSTVEVVQVMVLTGTGELRLVELESAGALKFTESTLASDLSHYLDVVHTKNRRAVRRLQIQTVGSGERQLYVSYTSESPIWKTTYRIVLDPDKKPLLQGWAIVDNTTPMDWVDIALSLVAGAPVSFVQNLSQPLYARRPVVPLPEGLQVSPQLHEATLEMRGGQTGIAGTVRDIIPAVLPGVTVRVFDTKGNLVRQTVTDDQGRYRIAIPPGTYKVDAHMAGFDRREYSGIEVTRGRTAALDFTLEVGNVTERVKITAAGEPISRMRQELRAAMPDAPAPAAAESFAGGRVGDVLRKQKAEVAQTQALGEQFEYQLRRPVSIRRNQSALLPIIHTEVDGEKVSVYNASSGERHPRLAVWLKNSKDLTLDAGSFTVIDTNAFAGEGLTETIQPGETRLLSYALDLGLEVSADTRSDRQRVRRVEISRGVLRMQSKLTERKNYIIRNHDQKDRTVVIEHPVRAGWKLVETSAPIESTSSYHRFKIEAKPKTTTEFTVREERPDVTTYSVSNVTSQQITLWLRQRSIDSEIENALTKIVAKKNEINELRQKVSALQREQNEIFRDQERVRGNLQRLRQSPEEASLRQRYIGQLVQQEDRLATMRAEQESLETARATAQKQLDEMLQDLAFDRTL